MTLTLAIMLGLTSSSSALSQHRAKRRTPRPTPARKAVATPKVTPAPMSNFSTGGISFDSVAPDGEGGVWFGGRVLYSGLLVHSANDIKAVALHNLLSITDLTFTTPKTGWFISQGDLYSTRDITKELVRVNIDNRQYLNRVYFFSPQRGWVIGESGAIFHTDDGGLTWKRQNSGTDYDLRQIQFVSPLDGWITASEHRLPAYRHTFLATNDGGKSWRELRHEDSPSPHAFSFVDSFEGWAVDLNNNIVHTDDGGKSWSVRRPAGGDGWAASTSLTVPKGGSWATEFYTPPTGARLKYQEKPSNRDAGTSLSGVYFSDSQNGWAVGFFRALTTNDGGTTWKTISEAWKQPIFSATLGKTAANR